MLKKISEWREAREAKALLEKYRREAVPSPAGIDVPRMFGYIHYKAFRYLAHGPNKYRKGDFFHLPPIEWSSDKLAAVRQGCEQILQWRGLSPESPIEGIGITGFYALLQLFHFKLKKQSALDAAESGMILDRMEMQHAMNPDDELTLYNLVEAPGKI